MDKGIVNVIRYPPVPVAYDHGYSYLKTQDVSGAAFQGASDGALVTRRRGNLNERRKKGMLVETGGNREHFFCDDFF